MASRQKQILNIIEDAAALQEQYNAVAVDETPQWMQLDQELDDAIEKIQSLPRKYVRRYPLCILLIGHRTQSAWLLSTNRVKSCSSSLLIFINIGH